MKRLPWITVSILVLAVLLVSEAVNAYMMYGGYYYPTRNYYMMDYYNQYPYQSNYYNPYTYAYGGYGYNPYTYAYSGYGGYGGYRSYGNYYNDPNWKYYTLDSFMRGPRYGRF